MAGPWFSSGSEGIWGRYSILAAARSQATAIKCRILFWLGASFFFFFPLLSFFAYIFFSPWEFYWENAMKLKIEKIQLCCTRGCQEACIHHSLLLPQGGQPSCSGSKWVTSLHCPPTLLWRGGLGTPRGRRWPPGTAGIHRVGVKTRKLKDVVGLWDPMWDYLCASQGVGAVPALPGRCGDQGTDTAEMAALASNPWCIFVFIFRRPM